MGIENGQAQEEKIIQILLGSVKGREDCEKRQGQRHVSTDPSIKHNNFLTEDSGRRDNKKLKQIYQLPTVVVTNYQKFSGLKQYKCIMIQFWKSEV